MGYARRVGVSVIYKGTDISEEVNRDLEEISYTDVASGESDSVTINISDSSKKWIGAWFPTKGDYIKVSIMFFNWYKHENNIPFDCGEFQVDDIGASGRPITFSIGGASIPQDNGFNAEKRTVTRESTTLEQIAQEIAGRAGIALYYEADSISMKAIEQTNETDCKFLFSLCESYGLAMKVYANKIVIFEEERYEKNAAVCTLRESDLENWSFNTTTAGTYTGAVFSFTDPDNEKDYEVQIGGGDRILNINVTADDIYDAERKGIAKLNNENKKETTMSVTIMANPSIVAGTNVQIEDLGKLSGKYYVDKVKSKFSGSGGTKQTLTLRKITERIKNVAVKAVEDAKEEAAAEGTQYTVVSGDTLWGIAKRFLGAGTRYAEIYNKNKETIESTAREHGKADSSNGHWIWPGEVLTIPPK